jgi:hypothetical protein
MTQCDPSPGAANSCPAGYHCAPDGYCDAQCTQGGSECGDGYHCTADGQCLGDGQCEGLQCQVVDCDGMGMPETTISGTVYAPNGTLPLYGVNVYIPNSDPGPLPDGAQCGNCATALPGSPVVSTTTDEAGHFTLPNVPAGANIPLVISSGKWRRQITIPNVGQCQDNALQAADTRLPKDHTEGDIPKIALTTGSADSLECLIRKLGIADSEITNSSGPGRVHFYKGNGVGKFNSTWAGGAGQSFSSATDFWNNVDNLKAYDIVILSCEGAQNQDTKPQPALDAMKAYADLGGRVFMSHWHNIWIEGSTQDSNHHQAPAVWPSIANWSNGDNTPDPVTDLIDEVSNPKGQSFATWMLNVMGSTTRDEIVVHEGRTTCSTVDNTKAERWTYWQDGNDQEVQNFQFSTPNEADPSARCGKVVFSDMHVSGGPGSGDYPDSCRGGTDLTPQEKALAFMLFDLSSCVGSVGREAPPASSPVNVSPAARL